MLDWLLAFLERLKVIPGLGFLTQVQRDLEWKKMDAEKQTRKINNLKREWEIGAERAKEAGSMLKGSKKRA